MKGYSVRYGRQIFGGQVSQFLTPCHLLELDFFRFVALLCFMDCSGSLSIIEDPSIFARCFDSSIENVAEIGSGILRRFTKSGSTIGVGVLRGVCAERARKALVESFGLNVKGCFQRS
jgi:hypothetical protein